MTRLAFPSAPLACALGVAALLALGGCASETLFQSKFDTTPVGQPPAAAQAVGTAVVAGDVKVATHAGSNEHWVRMTRPSSQDNAAPNPSFRGVFAKTYDTGTYSFLGAFQVPAGAGLASVDFATGPAGGPANVAFLHLDFTPEGQVRIGDDDATRFGSFAHDQPFDLSVGIDVTATSAVAHIALIGATASGTRDWTIPSPYAGFARQFGSIQLWMGWPWTGAFDATGFSVVRRTP